MNHQRVFSAGKILLLKEQRRREARNTELTQEVENLKRKYLSLGAELELLQSKSEEYDELRREHRVLLENVQRGRKIRKYISSLIQAGSHIERNLSFASPLLRNSNFLESLGLRLLLQTADLTTVNLPDLSTPSGQERSTMLENFIKSQESLMLENQPSSGSREVDMTVRSGTDTTHDFVEKWIRIEVTNFPVAWQKLAEFSEWCVSSKTYLDILRHYILLKHGHSDFNVEAVNSLLQSIEISNSHGKEKLFSFVQDFKTNESFTSVRALLPTVDFDCQMANIKATSYIEVIKFSKGVTEKLSNFALVRRLKTPKVLPHLIEDVTYLPSYESTGLQDYLNDFGMQLLQVAASIKIFFVLAPYIKIRK